ncbi:MAG: hypothetical protein HRU78_00120 [Gammaproteobacteria bacterium]|nr:MAG: hypothetical protein HRU78_00120 [Gammaproteobacteria bacterium]
MTQIRIFLSTVSAEFRSYRDALRRDLDRPNVPSKYRKISSPPARRRWTSSMITSANAMG